MDYRFYLLILLFIIASGITVYISIRIKEKYEEDDFMLVQLRKKFQAVFPELMENVILLRGDKSYTINKKRITLCLTDEKGDYYAEHMLTYVLLHELAHVKCPEIGHTTQFNQIFKELLDIAEQHALYDPSIPIIKDYCEYKN
jgi:hypothetical protein